MYSRQLISPYSNTSRRISIHAPPPAQIPSLSDFPRDPVQPDDLAGWRSLFRARQEWAEDVQIKALEAASELNRNKEALAIIQRGTEVALGNLQSHIRTLDQKYQEASSWAHDHLQEQNRTIEEAGEVIPYLDLLPAKTALFKYLPKLSEDVQAPDEDQSTLADLANRDDYQREQSILQKSQKSLRAHLEALKNAVEDVIHDTDSIIQSVKAAGVTYCKVNDADDEPAEEIRVLAEKIQSDSAHFDELTAEGRLAGQAIRIATLQTKNYLPTMVQYYDEIAHGIQATSALRDSFVQEAVHDMQRIAKTEASFASVHAKVSEFGLSGDAANALEAVSMVATLPKSYSVLLVESTRRKEWSDTIRSKAATVTEDIAGYKEEEEKRRNKWLKTNRHLIASIPTSNATTFELNLQHSEDELPAATRTDLSAYRQALSKCPGFKVISDELAEAIGGLDRPAKKQPKNIKGFKSGSVYDAEISKSSFLSRDNNEISALKEINQKLEEELKAQKSRVRKLEHLVFNQSQANRSSSANMFQATARPESPVASPDPSLSPMPSPKSNVELLSRKASVTSRRASSNKPQDEKVLARRIVTLEAEVYEATQNHQVLEKEKRQLEIEVEQARMTTKDLLDNMNAQQREFADERRVLREEITEWKSKLEDIQDELERTLESQENDKTQSDERLRTALEQIAEVEATLERRLEEDRDHKTALAAIRRDMQNSEDAETEVSSSLTLSELIHDLTHLSDQAGLYKLRLQEAVDDAKSENKHLQSAIDQASVEHGRMRVQHKSLQRSHDLLKADLETREARLATLDSEIEDGRLQLRSLRAKFTEGETGSAVLQQRLENQAAKATQAVSDLAEAQAELDHLKHELTVSRSTQLEAGTELTAIIQRLSGRSTKDAELSHRLANYVKEMSRLLEALGLSLLEREDGSMTIQRTSKLTSNSQTLSDLNSPSSVSPLGRPFDLTIPQDLLHWHQTPSLPAEDIAFGAFLSRLDVLDLPALSDSILKLRRDVEWTGKKWKAEARSYRDKFHVASADSNHKIAFRAFKEGDLALFLPTRNQAMRPWAAFNIGAPHYFLRETDSHHLQSREWLVARISKIQERVVDLSGKTSDTLANCSMADTKSLRSTASSSGVSFEDDNPFDLSDGLRWYLIDAVEEKTGASSLSVMSSTAKPMAARGLRTANTMHGKADATIDTACVDATGTSVKISTGKSGDASTKLGQSLDSRRSSTASRAGSIRATRDGASDVGVRVDLPKTVGKKSSMANVSALARGLLGGEAAKKTAEEDAGRVEDARNIEVRKDQLWGP